MASKAADFAMVRAGPEEFREVNGGEEKEKERIEPRGGKSYREEYKDRKEERNIRGDVRPDKA